MLDYTFAGDRARTGIGAVVGILIIFVFFRVLVCAPGDCFPQGEA